MAFTRIQKLRHNILYARTPPKKTAASLAIGVAIALGPLPGLHLITAFILTKLFRLNGLVMVTGVFLHNPWTALPIHALGLAIGDLFIFGELASIDKFKLFPWHELGFLTIFKSEFWQANGELLLSFLPPFILGSSLMALIAGVSIYQITWRYLIRSIPHEVKH